MALRYNTVTLLTVHRGLIAMTIIACGVFAAWELRANAVAPSPARLIAFAISVIVAVALAIYLWRIRKHTLGPLRTGNNVPEKQDESPYDPSE